MHKKIPYGHQTITPEDVRAVTKILRSDYLTQGKTIDIFEEKVAHFCGAKYAVAFSSGTAALHGACFAVEIKKGDEVITTPMTFAASANCVLYQGGTPVFADIKSRSPFIDPAEIPKKITKKTKAIIPVDYSGMPADYDEITQLARKNNLIVIADAAHSLGAEYKKRTVGTLADMTILSFHPVKIITTGEGGMVVTNNKFFYERLKIFRTHGITKDRKFLHKKNEGVWYYEMLELGFNYRLTDLQAALGISQLTKISQFIKKRNQIAHIYKDAFKNFEHIKTLDLSQDRTSAWHLFPIKLQKKLVSKKMQIFNDLHTANIAVQVHYIPVHLHPYYQKMYGYKKGDFPNSEDFYAGEISLPMFAGLKLEDVDYVISTLRKIIKKYT